MHTFLCPSLSGLSRRVALPVLVLLFVPMLASAASPVPFVDAGGRAYGATVVRPHGGSVVISVVYQAQDDDWDLTGIRPNAWHPATNWFQNNGGAMVPQSGCFGAVVWPITLDKNGDWYFWTDAEDLTSFVNSGAWSGGYKLTVLEDAPAGERSVFQDIDGDGIPDEIVEVGGPTFTYRISDAWEECTWSWEYVYGLDDYFDLIDSDFLDLGMYRNLFSYIWTFGYSSCDLFMDIEFLYEGSGGYDFEIFQDWTGDGIVRASDWTLIAGGQSDDGGVSMFWPSMRDYEFGAGQFFLVRYGKPLGSLHAVTGSGAIVTPSGYGSGSIHAALSQGGSVTLRAVDTVGKVVGGAASVLWRVVDALTGGVLQDWTADDRVTISDIGRFVVFAKLGNGEMVARGVTTGPINLVVQQEPGLGEYVGVVELLSNEDDSIGDNLVDADHPGTFDPDARQINLHYTPKDPDTGVITLSLSSASPLRVWRTDKRELLLVDGRFEGQRSYSWNLADSGPRSDFVNITKTWLWLEALGVPEGQVASASITLTYQEGQNPPTSVVRTVSVRGTNTVLQRYVVSATANEPAIASLIGTMRMKAARALRLRHSHPSYDDTRCPVGFFQLGDAVPTNNDFEDFDPGSEPQRVALFNVMRTAIPRRDVLVIKDFADPNTPSALNIWQGGVPTSVMVFRKPAMSSNVLAHEYGHAQGIPDAYPGVHNNDFSNVMGSGPHGTVVYPTHAPFSVNPYLHEGAP